MSQWGRGEYTDVTRIARPASVLLALLALAGPPAATAAAAPSSDPRQLSYTGLRTSIHARAVKSAELHPQQGLADLTMRGGKRAEAQYPAGDQNLAQQLSDAGAQVTVDNATSPGPMTIVPLVLIVVATIGFGVFMAVKGKARARWAGRAAARTAARSGTARFRR